MTGNRELFTRLVPLEKDMKIRVADDRFVTAIAKGEILCDMFDGKKWNKNLLVDVLFIPGFGCHNLFYSGECCESWIQDSHRSRQSESLQQQTHSRDRKKNRQLVVNEYQSQVPQCDISHVSKS